MDFDYLTVRGQVIEFDNSTTLLSIGNMGYILQKEWHMWTANAKIISLPHLLTESLDAKEYI